MPACGVRPARVNCSGGKSTGSQDCLENDVRSHGDPEIDEKMSKPLQGLTSIQQFLSDLLDLLREFRPL